MRRKCDYDCPIWQVLRHRCSKSKCRGNSCCCVVDSRLQGCLVVYCSWLPSFTVGLLCFFVPFLHDAKEKKILSARSLRLGNLHQADMFLFLCFWCIVYQFIVHWTVSFLQSFANNYCGSKTFCNVHSEERAGFIGNHGITHLVSCLTFLKTKSTKDFYVWERSHLCLRPII